MKEEVEAWADGLEMVVRECKIEENVIIFAVGSSVQFSRSVMSDSLQPHELQHTRPPCPSPSLGVHSDSRPSSP